MTKDVQELIYPYAKHAITQADCDSVLKALKSDKITRGPITQEFEKAIANYVGARFALTFNSGTAALQAAYFAAEACGQDRLITCPNSFVATTGAALQCGVKPYFVDIDLNSGNIDLEKLERLINMPLSRGRLIIAPVHFAGIAVDMKKLSSCIKNPDSLVIEDGAHALGSSYPTGEKVGSCAYSDMTILSFHPAKHITTGEGGAVTTNDEKLYHRLRLFRNNGIERKKPYLLGEEEKGYYEVQALTGNYHISEFSAALGLSQFQRLDSLVERRRQHVRRYRGHFEGVKAIRLFSPEFDERTAYHLMCLQINFKSLTIGRQELMTELAEEGIGTEIHYIPIYRHPAVKKLYQFDPDQFPNCEQYWSETLSIPLYPTLEEKDVDCIATTLKGLLQ